jgi:putative multiple sugar transport system substrate-binding protein
VKKLAMVILVLFIAGSLFAGGGAQKGGTTMMGMAMPETHVLRWLKDGQSLVQEAQKRGYAALVNWANADQPTQNQQIQALLTQGAKV